MTQPAPQTVRPSRIGAVNYLNSKPLVYRLAERAAPARVLFDLPSRLADSLAAGRLDVALIPVVESFADPAYRRVSDACVASNGPVRSVKVYFRRPPAEVQTLALDEGSRTSAALARVLMWRRYGIEPTRQALPIGRSVDAVDSDAVLLIGDRAMLPPAETFVETWDLATEWRRWTGLPFVFACWVARAGIDTVDVATQLAAARDEGATRLAEVAAVAGPPVGIAAADAHDYLTRNLHFRLGPAEHASLERFRAECSELGLLPEPIETSR